MYIGHIYYKTLLHHNHQPEELQSNMVDLTQGLQLMNQLFSY